MSTDATTTSASRAQRLDRLPFNREHGRLVVGSGPGWAMDAMDVGLISFVMAALAVPWSPRWPAGHCPSAAASPWTPPPPTSSRRDDQVS